MLFLSRRALCRQQFTGCPPDFKILDTAKDSIDNIYPFLRAGRNILVKESLEVAATYQHYLVELCQLELPAVDVPSLVQQQCVTKAMNDCLLIDRDLESYPDFIDAFANTTFSLHREYFEETHWNKSIGREMLKYAEAVYPKISHQYLSVATYLSLIDAFAASRNGVAYPKLLGSSRLRPMFGVHVPKAIHLQHVQLFRTWFRTMRKPLMLDRVLCLSSGLGVLPLALCEFKLHGIFCTDPNPRAIESLVESLKTYREGSYKDTVICQNAALFPQLDTSKLKFDCVVYSPDILRFSTYEVHETPYAPGLSGIDGEIETFFEKAAEYLRDWGVAVVVTTNFRTLLEPSKPHPVEYEIKHNRRWVVLDYYEAPMKRLDHAFPESEFTPKFVQRVRDSLRAEIWILHTVEAIGQFGFVHGVPNAAPPDAVRSSWGNRRLKQYQKRVIRECADSIGTTVRNIRDRLASVLSDADESADKDSEAEYIQMKLDPARFMAKLKAKREEYLKTRDADRLEREEHIARSYAGQSPRDVFDTKWADVHREIAKESAFSKNDTSFEKGSCENTEGAKVLDGTNFGSTQSL